jgi:hypothetical protein
MAEYKQLLFMPSSRKQLQHLLGEVAQQQQQLLQV